MELAARLLRDDPAWTAERLAAEAAAGRPLQISLAKPMPVAIVYLTAWVNSEGLVQFRRDLYQLDAAPAKSARPEGCGPTGFAAAL
jgi:L,D-transpeptidase YcbB